jgi:hypothetical protein
MRKEWVRTVCPNIHKTLGVLWGNSWIPEIPTTGVWLFVEGTDHEVRRENITPVSATKEKVWPATVPVTLGSSDPKSSVRGAGESGPPYLSS